jgi:hypothetical protein
MSVATKLWLVEVGKYYVNDRRITDSKLLGSHMLSEPRAIFFQTELVWPPFEPFSIERDVIRRLYNRMFEANGYEYPNLDLQSETPTLSRSDANGKSTCRFDKNSLVIEERTHNITQEVFAQVVETVLGGLQEEHIPPFFIQKCRIHCLAQPHNCKSSIDLLAAEVANVYESIQPFGRPPSFFGVRFRFEPLVISALSHSDNAEEGVEQAGEHAEAAESHEDIESHIECEGFVSLRFETYEKDISQVWMEVVAAYPQETPLTVNNTHPITENIRKTYAFLTERSKRFLDQFDVARDNNGAEHDGP